MADVTDGRHDFDFLAGRWKIANRKLENPAPEESPVWLEFDSTVESRPILGGLGNVDTYHVADLPGRGEYHGLALRLFEAEARFWRIWWASNPGTGDLEPPLVGRFVDGEGHFEADDTLAGRAIKVRFRWSQTTSATPRWEQSFSFDGGGSFAVNWIMDLEREAADT